MLRGLDQLDQLGRVYPLDDEARDRGDGFANAAPREVLRGTRTWAVSGGWVKVRSGGGLLRLLAACGFVP